MAHINLGRGAGASGGICRYVLFLNYPGSSILAHFKNSRGRSLRGVPRLKVFEFGGFTARVPSLAFTNLAACSAVSTIFSRLKPCPEGPKQSP